MNKVRFYYCPICGNIVEKVIDSGNDMECCGRTMLELVPGVTDGKHEWHVPVCEINGNVIHVKIGELPHPMDKDHYIEWIEIVTTQGISRKCLAPGNASKMCFALCEDEKVCSIYAYCNRHKLWKLKVCDI